MAEVLALLWTQEPDDTHIYMMSGSYSSCPHPSLTQVSGCVSESQDPGQQPPRPHHPSLGLCHAESADGQVGGGLGHEPMVGKTPRVPALASGDRGMVALPRWPYTMSLTPVHLWTWVLLQDPKDYVIAASTEFNARVRTDRAMDHG